MRAPVFDHHCHGPSSRMDGPTNSDSSRCNGVPLPANRVHPTCVPQGSTDAPEASAHAADRRQAGRTLRGRCGPATIELIQRASDVRAYPAVFIRVRQTGIVAGETTPHVAARQRPGAAEPSRATKLERVVTRAWATGMSGLPVPYGNSSEAFAGIDNPKSLPVAPLLRRTPHLLRCDEAACRHSATSSVTCVIEEHARVRWTALACGVDAS